MTICADIIDELVHDSGVANLVGSRVFGGVVPAGVAFPFIWVQRRGVDYAGALEGEAEPLREFFDLECVSLVATEAAELSDAVRACLHKKSGVIGGGNYTWCSVSDAAETYVPRNLDAAEHLFVSSLDVEVIRP